ncbi:Os02g0548801 [Oryza sativa Japonica Group]|uniref:Os02g0548801 protein n=1 Tax=Oryza sativa subsp. japonica TaxID=39947 RepID=A0A0P0VKC4_ORYSJ|nr:Os02g0548801 [Oryza sativa Japonica Group]
MGPNYNNNGGAQMQDIVAKLNIKVTQTTPTSQKSDIEATKVAKAKAAPTSTMDISQATKEPLPSHGQHQLVGRDYNMLSLPSVAAPQQQATPTSSAETTEECVAHHKNEADPKSLGLAKHQGKKAFKPKRLS